jgi:hypothetical protein
VDVRIGVTYSNKEIEVDLDQEDPAKVRTLVDKAIGGGAASVLWLTDRKGRQVGVPVERISYVEIGARDGERRIGFAGA